MVTRNLTTAIRRAFREALLHCPASKMARELGVPRQTIMYWRDSSARGPSAHHVIAIEMLTGVSRHELRPDIYPVE